MLDGGQIFQESLQRVSQSQEAQMVPYAIGMLTRVILQFFDCDIQFHFYCNPGKLLHRQVEENNQILALDYNRDGSCFASAGKDYKVKF